MHTIEPIESQNSYEAYNEPILDRDDNDDDDNQNSKYRNFTFINDVLTNIFYI